MREFTKIVNWMLCGIFLLTTICQAQTSPEKIIIDTDIGDDVDDAFAVALALRSPELQILGTDVRQVFTFSRDAFGKLCGLLFLATDNTISHPMLGN